MVALRGSLLPKVTERLSVNRLVMFFLTRSDEYHGILHFVRLDGCTRQDATHELLPTLIKARCASWVTFAESDRTFERESPGDVFLNEA